MKDLQDKLLKLLVDTCSVKITDFEDIHQPLLKSGLDSLDFVSFLMAIEDHFELETRGISFSSDDIENLQSLKQIQDYLSSNGF